MITLRDTKVIDFLQTYHVATTDTIATLFYPSNRVARNRLNAMITAKEIKRERSLISQQYEYYIRRPKQYRHSLLLTEFYRELNKIAKIHNFVKEPTLLGIRPDALIGYEINGVKKIAIVEVETSNKGLDVQKYENIYNSNRYKEMFTVMPKVIAITDKRVPKTNIDISKIDTMLTGLNRVM